MGIFFGGDGPTTIGYIFMISYMFLLNVIIVPYFSYFMPHYGASHGVVLRYSRCIYFTIWGFIRLLLGYISYYGMGELVGSLRGPLIHTAPLWPITFRLVIRTIRAYG